MALVILESTGPRGDDLIEQAAGALGLAAGADPDFDSVTLDSDEHETEEALTEDVENTLDDLDPDWRSQVRFVD
jgi:hypothetical protein